MNFIFAAKITGIVLIILYTIGGFYVLIDDKKVVPWYKVLLGMVFINLINGLLVYGAIKRNGSFLTLWIVLSIIVIISFIIESIIGKEINYSTMYHLSTLPRNELLSGNDRSFNFHNRPKQNNRLW